MFNGCRKKYAYFWLFTTDERLSSDIRLRPSEIYTILKASVSTVVPRYFFTNNPSQLFQINLLHAYRWPNGSPAWANARGPQLWHRHVMLACWMCRANPLTRRPIWLNLYLYSILYLKHQFQRSSRGIFLQITPYSYSKLTRRTPIDGQNSGPTWARRPRATSPGTSCRLADCVGPAR
jgi:hypothetical protein